MTRPSFPRVPPFAIIRRPRPGWWLRTQDDVPTKERPPAPGLIEESVPDTAEYELEEVTDPGWPE